MRVIGGSSTSLSFATPAEVVAIVLGESLHDQPPGTTWEVFVDVILEEAGYSRLGALRTRPVSGRLAPPRVIGFAACPGARGWRVLVGNAVPGSVAEVFLAGRSGSEAGTMLGVYPNDPLALNTDAESIPW